MAETQMVETETIAPMETPSTPPRVDTPMSARSLPLDAPIHTEISATDISFDPSKPRPRFTLTVFNKGDCFASFQVALIAAGVGADLPTKTPVWYRLDPSVSSKIPVGDRTEFDIEITGVPPVPGGFAGAMTLTVRVYSPELKADASQEVRLMISGSGLQPPRLEFTKPQWSGSPGDDLEIQAAVTNPNRQAMELDLLLEGVPGVSNLSQRINLEPQHEETIALPIQVPGFATAQAGIYPITLTTLQTFSVDPRVSAELEINQKGEAIFSCDPLEKGIPELPSRWFNPREGTATFDLKFDNASNLPFTTGVTVQTRSPWPANWKWIRLPWKPETLPESATALPSGLTLNPEVLAIAPGQTDAMELTIRRRLPWLGWPRLQRFQVKAEANNFPLDVEDDTHELTVQLSPVIPVWLQLLGGSLLLITALILWSILTRAGHTGPVNRVQFNGQGNEVISVSDDQTMRRWKIQDDRLLPLSNATQRLEKSIRVGRYRPLNNDRVVLGLENGQIRLHNLLTDESTTLEAQRDDRIFDAVFTRDARTLFTAHGSGAVLQWSLDPKPQSQPVRAVKVPYAIEAIALVGEEDQIAIAGRYNQLNILNLQTKRFVTLPTPAGTANDYIVRLATAEQSPETLAMADNQGYVTLWDVPQCIEQKGKCEPRDRWLAHGGSAVRGVALTQDGCYLASSGDNGQVKLWSLGRDGKRNLQDGDGKVVMKSSKPINSVDIIARQHRLWIVSGNDDHHVQLTTQPVSSNSSSCSGSSSFTR